MFTSANQPMFRFLAVLTAASMAGLQGYTILFNNFAVETVHLEGLHVGLIQSVREIPGFLALTAIYVMLVIREHRLAAFSISLLGLGVALTGLFPSFGGVAVTTLIMSFGFHYYETVNQSLTLQYFSTHQSPLVMGRLRSLAAITSIISAALIWCLGFVMSYSGIFMAVGGTVFVAGIWAAFQDPTHAGVPPQKLRMFLKRRYWLYYLLTFMSGARRQIYMVFSMFLLVKEFHFSVQTITALFIINNFINWIINPMIGRAINAFGERTLCTLEYAGVIAVFLTYAYASSPWVVGGMYIIDYILFNFAVAIRTYFQKIAAPEDIAPTSAVGFTINHIAAVFLPALGGYLWMINYRIPFIMGAVLGFVSLIAAQFIRVPPPHGAAVQQA
ncbi:MAG: major facilitator superfamily 1 [Deltaproteobacteria bacterium]|nr:major facilitator superfamily 1 [Deltaproteobacteria bacterium]